MKFSGNRERILFGLVLATACLLMWNLGCCRQEAPRPLLVPLPPVGDCNMAPSPEGFKQKFCARDYETGAAQCVYFGPLGDKECYVTMARKSCEGEWGMEGLVCRDIKPGVAL